MSFLRPALPILTLLAGLLVAIPVQARDSVTGRGYARDGDTIVVSGVPVRLNGIDAPETSKKKHVPGQPFGRKAERYLAGLVLNKVVDIKGYGSDRYGRILAEIYIDDKDITRMGDVTIGPQSGVWFGAVILGTFFVMSISAWYVLHQRHGDFARRSFTGGLLSVSTWSRAWDPNARRAWPFPPSRGLLRQSRILPAAG